MIVVTDDQKSTASETMEEDEKKKIELPLRRFILLSAYAFLVMFQPSGPFLVPYFVKEKGLTTKEVRFFEITVHYRSLELEIIDRML